MVRSPYKKVKPIVFCNIGWNTYYLGDPEDRLRGGGAYPDIHGTGNEHDNFRPFIISDEGMESEDVFLLGSYETMSTNGCSHQTHVENIHGCSALKKEDAADDVIVVWCAKDPEHMGHTRVVGWYRHATVYRYYQELPIDEEDGSEWTRVFNVSCAYEDAVLLPEEVRRQPQWEAPRHHNKGQWDFGFGRSHIWYASELEAKSYVLRMIEQIESYTGENCLPELCD